MKKEVNWNHYRRGRPETKVLFSVEYIGVREPSMRNFECQVNYDEGTRGK